MSLIDQLQTVVASVSALEQALNDRTILIDGLNRQIATLVADNATLRHRIESLPPTPVPPIPVPPIETEPATATAWGFAANETDPAAAFRPALVRMKADGGTWVRLWHGSFDAISPGTAACVAAATAAGVRVILCVQPKDTNPKPLGSPDFAGFVARNTAVLKDVALVEAGNELNLAQYRPDDLGGGDDWHKPYVDRWLRPLSTALAAAGVKTLCASVTDTYHPDNYGPQYDALLAAGAADCCDGVALHAYFLPQSLQLLAGILAHVRATWSKPIHLTECNVLTKGLTPAQWQQRFPPYLATLRQAGVASVMFYRGFAKANGKWTWPTLFDKAGTPTDAYGLLRAAMQA